MCIAMTDKADRQARDIVVECESRQGKAKQGEAMRKGFLPAVATAAAADTCLTMMWSMVCRQGRAVEWENR